MAKAYYFNYKSVSDTSQYPTDEVVYICSKMAQIVIAAFKEYGLHVKNNDFFLTSKGEKLLSDEKSFCCMYPDKCDVAWDPSTWDYGKDKSGEIFVVLKNDNKIVVSFGTNRIAKKSTNEEIISRIRDKAVASGILSEESVIYETEERIVEKPKSNDIEKLKSNDISKPKDNDIEKHVERRYAKAELYGYGFLEEYGLSPVRTRYAGEVYIMYGNGWIRTNGISFDMGMGPITLKRKNFSGDFQDVEQPLYLVEDDGVWKEYFSGTEIKYMEYRGSKDGIYHIGDNFKGIREIVFSDKIYCSMGVQAFANEISRYSDAEKKSMVGQFLRLKENAETWGAKFDKVVEEFTKNYESKNEMASNKLADGIGKYANVQPGFSDEIILDGKQMQSANKGTKEDKKNQNGLVVALVIALIVVCFLWIIK